MKRRNISTLAAAALTLVLAGCTSSSAPEVSVGPLETATVSELDAAVRPAAQALLDAPGLRIATVYFDFADPETVSRFDWLEYQSTTDYLVVTNQIQPRDAAALLVIDNTSFSATAGATGSQPWTATGVAQDNPVDSVEALRLLAAMTEQATPTLVAGSERENEVTRQQDSEGNTLWTLNSPGPDPELVTMAAQWIISSDGVLQFYRVSSEVEPISGASGIVYEYGVADDLERREPPEVDSLLDLEELDVPAALRDLNDE